MNFHESAPIACHNAFVYRRAHRALLRCPSAAQASVSVHDERASASRRVRSVSVGPISASLTDALSCPSSSLVELVEAVRSLPDGRPRDRTVGGMLRERRGTCSTKHLFLAEVLGERFPKTRRRSFIASIGWITIAPGSCSGPRSPTWSR